MKFKWAVPVAIAVVMVQASQGAEEVSKNAAEAIEAAKQYTASIKAGDGLKAVESTWNFNAIFDSIFGDAMKKETEAQRATMRKGMLSIIGMAYKDPKINDLMMKATFDHFTAVEAADKSVSVDFDFSIPNNAKIANTLRFVKDDKGWRIVDSATNGQYFSALIREIYKNKFKGAPHEFVQAMVNEK